MKAASIQTSMDRRTFVPFVAGNLLIWRVINLINLNTYKSSLLKETQGPALLQGNRMLGISSYQEPAQPQEHGIVPTQTETAIHSTPQLWKLKSNRPSKEDNCDNSPRQKQHKRSPQETLVLLGLCFLKLTLAAAFVCFSPSFKPSTQLLLSQFMNGFQPTCDTDDL